MSPPEMMYAFVQAIYRDYKGGASSDTMSQWRNMALSVTMVFKVIEKEDDKHFTLLQQRQDMQADGLAMTYTVLQSIYDLIAFRDRKGGTLKAPELAKAYKEHVRWCGDEKDTPSSTTFVDASYVVYNRMLSNPIIAKMLLDAQESVQKPNPLDKITKLLIIAQKAKGNGGIQWVLEMIFDLYYAGGPALSIKLSCLFRFFASPFKFSVSVGRSGKS